MTNIRPALIAVPLFAVLTAGAFTAATHNSAAGKAKADQQVCIVLSQDANHQHTQYYCVDWGKALSH